jgi:hypothetical protein
MIQKTIAMIERGMLQDATKLKLKALYTMNFIARTWRLVIPTAIKNL